MNAYASEDMITSTVAEYLTSHSPYTPLYEGIYTPVPLSDVVSGSRSFLSFPTDPSACTDFQWYDAGIVSCIDCPSGMRRSATNGADCMAVPTAATTSNTNLIVGVAVGGGVLLVALFGVGATCEVLRRSNSRSNSNAPRGEGSVALIFTDIKGSTKMWGCVPICMGVALDTHHHVIRQAIAEYKGYEVKTVGDCFMIAIDSAQRAVDMAVAIQCNLHGHAWPTAINSVYDQSTDVDEIVDDPDEVAGPGAGAPWNGLRIRIGIHYGPVEVVLDEVTKGYDYYGPTVNVAARIESITDGGQVCISGTTAAAISQQGTNYKVAVVGAAELRGVKEETQVFELLIKGFEGRLFERRIEVNNAASNNRDSDTFSTASLAANAVPLNAATRAIRDTVRETFKVLRGEERVRVLEHLRRAWRVHLPNGRHFTGTVIQPPKKVSKAKRRRQSGGAATSRSSYGGSQLADESQGTTAENSLPTKQEETDEDVIFRIVAQRLAPTLLKDESPVQLFDSASNSLNDNPSCLSEEDVCTHRFIDKGGGGEGHIHTLSFNCPCGIDDLENDQRP